MVKVDNQTKLEIIIIVRIIYYTRIQIKLYKFNEMYYYYYTNND